MNSKVNIKQLVLYNTSLDFTHGSVEREDALNQLANGIKESKESRKIYMKKFYSSLLKNLSLNNRDGISLADDLVLQSETFEDSELLNSLNFLKEIKVQEENLNLPMQVKIISSSLDLLIPPADSEVINKKIKKSSFTVIENQGHLLPIEMPSILLNA
jgi:hypothetical protein